MTPENQKLVWATLCVPKTVFSTVYVGAASVFIWLPTLQPSGNKAGLKQIKFMQWNL